MKVNDVVFLLNEGIVRFVNTIEENIDGKLQKQYIFVPFYESRNNYQIMISEPMLSEKIRPIMSKENANKIIDSIRNFHLFEWENNNKNRRIEFENVVKSDDAMEISKMIYLVKRKECELKGTKKTLSKSDSDLMKRGMKLLFGELAYVLNTTIDEIDRCYNNFLNKDA